MINGPNSGSIKFLSDGKSFALIEKASDPFVYIAGKFSEKQLNEVLALCPDDAFLYCNPRYHHRFLTQGWKIFHGA